MLEDFAIKNGVQSTTRYRKRTGNQKVTKSENPAPSRQTSGRKGGISASKTKSSRQRLKIDASDLRRPVHRPETGRHPYQYQSQHRFSRDFSPLTPSPEEPPQSASPLFTPKSEPFKAPYEVLYSLENVQGVYIDNSPLFSNGYDSAVSPIHDLGQMSASQRY